MGTNKWGMTKTKHFCQWVEEKYLFIFLDREDGKGRMISGCVSKLRHGFTCTEKYRPHCQSVMDLKPGANIALTSTATTLNIGTFLLRTAYWMSKRRKGEIT